MAFIVTESQMESVETTLIAKKIPSLFFWRIECHDGCLKWSRGWSFFGSTLCINSVEIIFDKVISELKLVIFWKQSGERTNHNGS